MTTKSLEFKNFGVACSGPLLGLTMVLIEFVRVSSSLKCSLTTKLLEFKEFVGHFLQWNKMVQVSGLLH